MAVRSLAEHLLRDTELPAAQFLNPTIVLRSNLGLYRETAKAVESGE
jgi:hypothetical protein